jgi:hypothetical protein
VSHHPKSRPAPFPVLTRNGQVDGINPGDRVLITACPADTPPAEHPWTLRVQTRDTILEVGWHDTEWDAEIARRNLYRALRLLLLEDHRGSWR